MGIRPGQMLLTLLWSALPASSTVQFGDFTGQQQPFCAEQLFPEGAKQCVILAFLWVAVAVRSLGAVGPKGGPDWHGCGAHLAGPLVRCHLATAIHLQCNHSLRMGKKLWLKYERRFTSLLPWAFMFQLVVWAVVLELNVCIAACGGIDMKSLMPEHPQRFSGVRDFMSLWAYFRASETASFNLEVPKCWFSSLTWFLMVCTQFFVMTACISLSIVWTQNLAVLSSYISPVLGVCGVWGLWWVKERLGWYWPVVLVDDQIHGVGGVFFVYLRSRMN